MSRPDDRDDSSMWASRRNIYLPVVYHRYLAKPDLRIAFLSEFYCFQLVSLSKRSMQIRYVQSVHSGVR